MPRLMLRCKRISISLSMVTLLIFGTLKLHAAAPPNDSCGGAIPIVVGNGGFALGTFTSSNSDLTSATLQTGETFAPSILVAGLDKKSVWYKFTLPTTRSVRVSLLQPGGAIQAGNVGFAIYKTSSCIPGNAAISTKLSPIETFGSTFHPCVSDGDYYIQVSSNNNANGPIYLTLELADGSPAPYDKPATAYQFGDLTSLQQKFTDVDIDCQAIDDANEVCLPGSSFKDYTKSMWYTFKTPAYFDYLNTWFASLSTPYGSPPIKVGYRLYQGDGTITPINTLTQLGGCDSLLTDLYAIDRKQYQCGMLLPNTTYTVQLLFHKDFKSNIRFGTDWKGTKVTNGPLPVSSLPTPNKMGTLSSNSSGNGVMTPISDVFGCNSQHSQNSCPKSMPAAGLLYNNSRYNLSSFISFNLASTSSIFINGPVIPCAGNMLLRLYKHDLTASCTDLDTTNLISTFLSSTYSSSPLSCLAPGNYVLQVMAIDSARPNNSYHYSSLNSYSSNQMCTNLGLGSSYTLNISVRTEFASNKFDLSAPGRFERINANGAGVMQPLLSNITYTAAKDTFGCANTVLPSDTVCNPNASAGALAKASYRQFILADSAMLFFDLHNTWNSKLYQGDGDALTTAQNKHVYPERFTGLAPYSKCMAYYNSGFNPNACAIPGTYTHASFDERLSYASNLTITPRSGRSKYGTPATAQDMGDLWSYISANTWYQSGLDTFGCYDNAVPIDGVAPCTSQQGQPSTKAIYRQFYLSRPTLLSIRNYVGYSGEPYGYGVFTLFKGRVTDGINTLVKYSNAWTCFTVAGTSGQCDAVPAGWYTVVSYGSGPSYSDPTGGMGATSNNHISSLGRNDKFMIFLGQACATPKFNRPHKASVDTITNLAYKIEYSPQTGSTPAYPLLGKTFTLNKENFDCTQDTTFIRQRVNTCSSSDAKVAFYVFTTTQESYIKIGIPDGSIWGSVYAFDVRTADSLKLKNGTDTALHPCMNRPNQMEFCRLQPGIYTLVLFAPASYTCNSITPTIYIDSVGFSRFDHASKAYDFGAVQPDSVWYKGKSGDVNPYNAGRPPSNDFFYCTTGAQLTDPINGQGCYTQYNPYIYPSKPNQVLHPINSAAPSYLDRRTLWHTFTVNYPGTIRVKVTGRRGAQTIQPNFAVYSSDENGSLPFSTLQNNGLVDSSLLQGLDFKVSNIYYCPYTGYNQVSIYKDPCTFTPTRYYIVTDNFYTDNVNFQVDVEVLLDSVSASPPKFDHFSQANDMGLVNSGIKQGETDNFTCATRDLPDPINSQYVSNCNKTLWYKFSTTITGQIRYSTFFKNTNNYYYDHAQLFKQVLPNDSSSTGLKHLLFTSTYNNNGTWAQRCIEPGTYYLLLPGCNAINEDVYPQIEIIPAAGDFCSAPMITSINGAGSKVVPVTVDCHTIGTDYGEFNPTLTCPAGAVTSQYKTSWYRIDITGTDTLDVTVFINEKTNATSTDIKYRMMTGTCGAMQEQSCVQDALTQNTYKCLAPGNSYYIQVFSPVTYLGTPVNGNIDLNITAVAHADTCLPASTCIGVANFTPQFDCTKDKHVTFTNFSTYGSSIKYDWDFGFNNQTSNAVSPSFFYPALTIPKTYTVKLVLTNLLCGKKDSITKTITIPARPAANLGNDTIICANGSTLSLNATSHAGSTYYWYNGSTQPTLTLGGLNNNAWVEVTYGSCKTRDSISVFVNPIAKRGLQTKALCGVPQVTLDANRGQGEQYQWSNGTFAASITVSQPGIYWADIYWRGCIVRDSFQVVSTSLRPLGNDTTRCQKNMPFVANAFVSGATSYKWQNNSTASTFSINTAGVYWVDINLGGCTFRDSLTVAIDSFKVVTTSARICQGQTFTLPTGTIINTTGVYKDSLKNSRGCDSLITTFTLTVDTVKRVTNNVSLCLGQSYTLPSGTTVAIAGNYIDTLKNTRSCDSLITTLNLTIATVQRTNSNASICVGSTYKLPSGRLLSASGIYIDTLKAVAGCDSLITTLNLTVLTPIASNSTASICFGQTFTLPTGMVVNATGVYRDTIRYVIGCDSLIRTVALTVTPKPALGADKSMAVCFGNSINLTSQYATSGLTALWTLNAVPVSLPTAVSTAGIYQLIATNSSNCSDTAFVTVSITPKPNLGADKAASICQGNTFDLTAQFNNTGLTTSWTLAGAPVANPSSIASSGAYQLIARNTDGCADTAIFTLTVNAKPSLGADRSTSICVGSFSDLTAQFNSTGLTSLWTFNGLPVANAYAVNVAGTYQLIASNSNSCSDTALLTLIINAKPDLGIDKTAAICAGGSFNLNSQFSSTGVTSSSWTLNGVNVSNANAVSTSGVYQLIVTNAAGCKDTATLTLTVNPKPVLGADKLLSICQENTADLTAQFVTTGLTTNWTINGTTVANPTAITTAGIYQLIAINSSNCADTAMVNITVNPKPALGSDKLTSICDGNSVNLNSQFTTAGLSTSWTLNGGIVVNTNAVATAGVYQLIATNTSGCKDTALVTLTVNTKPSLGADKAVGICQGNTADLSAQFTTTGLATNWTLNGTAVFNIGTVTTAGVYQLIAANANGCSDTALLTLTVSPKPNLGADKFVAICTGNTVNLTTQFTSTGLASSWTNDGLSVSNPGAVSAAGTYQLIVTSSAGCKDTAAVTITVAPKPSLGVDKSAVICSGSIIDLTTQFATTGLITNWSINGAAVPNPAAVNQSGMYQLIATNSNGCVDTALFTLTVNPSPSLGVDKTVSVCTGGSANLTSQFITTGLTSSWSLNGNAITLPTAITSPGTYRLIVTNNSGCRDTALVTVSINALPTILVADPSPVCAPATINLTAASVTAGSTTGLNFTYWQDAANTIAVANAAAVPSGLYFIKGTDANGCFDSRPVTVTVYTLPLVSAGRDTTICDQSFAILRGNATNLGIGTVNYAWSPATGLSNANAATTTATPGASVTYRLTATVDYGSCVLTVADDVKIIMQPPVLAFAGNDTVAVSGVPHQLKATGGSTYLWSPSVVLNNPRVANPLATLRQDTRFTVTVTDIAGCKGSSSVLVKVYNGITYYVPSAFSPNGDGVNDVFRPIPAGIVSTEYFRIFSRYGQLVFETAQPLKGWDGTYRGTKQPIGNYVWTLKGMGNNGKVVEMKGNVVLLR